MPSNDKTKAVIPRTIRIHNHGNDDESFVSSFNNHPFSDRKKLLPDDFDSDIEVVVVVVVVVVLVEVVVVVVVGS